MFRKTVWKNTVSDAVSWHQDQALNTTILILKEYGPTGFLLKEEGETKNFKVCLGDPHTCACSTFNKERDLCKHICWVLLRKFRLPREHEYCFQQGLVERQILELLQGSHKSRTPRPVDPPGSAAKPTRPEPDDGDGSVRRKEIEADDVCPICQEDMLAKRLPVCYCRYGCGNSVHISCMKVWADHQARPEGEAAVKCPLCREDFGPVELLLEQVRTAAKLFTAAERERPDRHLGVLCNSCGIGPVTGKCFKCTVCRYYHLCEDCMGRRRHPQHEFAFRAKRSQKWQGSSAADGGVVRVESDPLPDHVFRSLPAVRVRSGCRLLDPGQQCRICLKSFQQGQRARHLPCHHRFHTGCIDPLLRQSNSCPLDGYVIYNPLTWSCAGGKATTRPASPTHAQAKLTEQHRLELFVPGVALLDRAARVLPSLVADNTEAPASAPAPLPRDTMVIDLQGLRIHKRNAEHIKRVAKKDRPLLQSVIHHKTLSSEHPRPDTCSMRLGSIKGTERELFVGVNRSDGDTTTATGAQPRAVVSLWKPRPRNAQPGTGDRQKTSGLRMTGVVIKHQREK
uniref:Zinc finger, SWIM-type containing 2 n=1 Tax=Esox lucius TaxID=8010 RepID=A0A6Q2Y748_ESOLU